MLAETAAGEEGAERGRAIYSSARTHGRREPADAMERRPRVCRCAARDRREPLLLVCLENLDHGLRSGVCLQFGGPVFPGGNSTDRECIPFYLVDADRLVGHAFRVGPLGIVGFGLLGRVQLEGPLNVSALQFQGERVILYDQGNLRVIS